MQHPLPPPSLHQPILVTGCAGFIGSHVVDQLLEAGLLVVGVDNLSTGRLENLRDALGNARFVFKRLDVTKTNRLRALVLATRPRAVIHLAALVSVPDAEKRPDFHFRINVETSHHLAEIARTSGVARIVFASSAAVYGSPSVFPVHEEVVPQPIGRYGAAKLASEHLLLAAAQAGGCPVTCLRFFNVFGPRQDPSSPYSGVISIFAARASVGEAVTIFGDGEQTRDFVAVEDVARAVVCAATDDRDKSLTLNICTGTEISLSSIAEMLAHIRPGFPRPNFFPTRKSDIRRSVGCAQRAREELRFDPRNPLDALRTHLTAVVCGDRSSDRQSSRPADPRPKLAPVRDCHGKVA